MTFLEHLEAINRSESVDNAVQYITDNFIEIQHVYYDESYQNGFDTSLKVIDVFFELLEKRYLNNNCAFSMALIEMLADFFERYRCVSALFQIQNLVEKSSPIMNRIHAALLFHRVNDATTDYFERFDNIINNLALAQEDGEVSYKSTITFINFYYTAITSFIRLNRADLIQIFINRIYEIKADFIFLEEKSVDQLLLIPFENFNDDFKLFFNTISTFIKAKLDKGGSREILEPEESKYTEELASLGTKNFVSIRRLSVDYLKNLTDRKKIELKNKLDSGVKIIDDPELLYSYMVAFGKMHYSKVLEAIEKISNEIENKSIEVYDWGCGQGLASMVLFDHIEKLKIKTDIEHLILIEPSELALKRGIAHVNFVYPKLKNVIIPICKDMDSIKDSDLLNSKKIKLHLFSNIIDVPSFNLNELCNRVGSLKGLNIFISVSPMHSEIGRQVRLQKFLEFFSNNFTTHVFAETFNTKMKNKWKSNYCPCENHANHNNESYLCRNAWTRHEIVFSSLIT